VTAAVAALRVMIVDDEPAARRTLRECCAAETDLEVVGEFGDPRAALAAIRAAPPHLLFLDIQMDTMSGIDLARSLDAATLPLIVFVTAYDQYALEAFEVCATDYLLKPFDEERFARALARVRQRHASGTLAERGAALDALLARLGAGAPAAGGPPRLLAEAHGRQHVLDPARIELVEADRNYVKIRVGTDSFHARSTLAQAEQALQSQPMLKVSRSCLVNMNHVREVSRTLRGDFILVLAGGATVTSSEGCRERVREYLERLKL
jgi:two-component system LytT family response regulator